MSSLGPFRSVFTSLIYFSILHILGFTSLFNFYTTDSTGFFFVDSAVTGNITQCVRNSDKLFDDQTCVQRLHTNVDVSHGLREYHYIYRRKDDLSKGLYLVLKTSNTSLLYTLNYQTMVPLYYTDHTERWTYSEISGELKTSCKSVQNSKCTKKTQVPPGIDFLPRVCCICGLNVHKPTPRADFKCGGFLAMGGRTALSMSCLEISEPWYKLYKTSYPPAISRSVTVNIYKFDSSTGIIPDVTLEDEDKFDNYDFKKREKKDPVIKSPEIKSRSTKEITGKKDELHPNFRRIIIDDTVKEEHINDLDVKITLLSSNTKDGSAPPLFDKYVAIPSFPRTNETVKGSSLMDKCQDSTWKTKPECPKYMNPSLCDIWRCTLNMRTVKMSAVDTDGLMCDKIGLSMKRWANQEEICNSSPGSCLKNQLKHYFDQEKDEAKLPKLYGVEPTFTAVKKDLSLPAVKEANKTTLDDPNRIHTLTYIHSKDDVTRLKIDTFDATVTEIISDFPGFIVSAKMDGECEVSSEKGCNMELDVKNMGVKKSEFTVRANCYDDPDLKNEVAQISETTLSIDGNKNKTVSIPIKLTGSLASEKGYCNIILLSGKKEMLDGMKMEIKVKVKKETFGKDPVKVQDIVAAPSPKDKLTTPQVINPIVINQPGSKNDTKKEEESQCKCASWNIFCMLINFKICVSSYVSKVLFYVLIALGILLLLILLPVLIPLIVSLFKALAGLIKTPLEALEQRRLKKKNNTQLEV
ncbi:Male gamete fusion factor family protein [Theileria parva strain Muguga]|uniref:Male gamete fusion factor family protein n=1 Tax=Theileria parva strain Muguga TaxID=333668 RepID=UPI001C618C54|nr:Male gamete fusion factor family protein [Theileria parva strain Muguga]EAN31926.2 Male gamete fusion factor family protein [Theileria parva strain Muguga]